MSEIEPPIESKLENLLLRKRIATLEKALREVTLCLEDIANAREWRRWDWDWDWEGVINDARELL